MVDRVVIQNFAHEAGTLGYVMSNLQGGTSFSATVQLAKSLGYTEPGYITLHIWQNFGLKRICIHWL